MSLACVVVAALWRHVEFAALASWIAFLSTSQTLRLLNWWHARRADRVARHGWSASVRLTLISTVTGLGWGGLAALLGDDASNLWFFVTFVLAGMTAGSVSVLAAHPPSYGGFLLGTLGPFALVLASGDQPLGGWLSLIVVMYGTGMGAVGWHLHRGQRRVAELYLHNTTLVDALEEARNDLEERVLARTAELETANARLTEEVRRRRGSERRLRELALVDPLTGLPNRELFGDRLEVALAGARRNGVGGAVAVVDIDRFKFVNDTWGHLAGDELLRRMARRLRGAMRASDTLARFGGDEFVALFAEIGSPEAALAAGRRLLDAVARPFDVRGVTMDVSLSVGVALFPHHGETADELLGSADLALYHAKLHGRSRVEVVGVDVVAASRAQRRHLETLRAAINAGEVHVVYGVRRRADDQKGVALVPNVEPPEPDILRTTGGGPMGVARLGGFVADLEEVVIARGLEALTSCDDETLILALTLSADTLMRPCFSRRLEAVLDQYRVAPERVEIGVEETAWQTALASGLGQALERLKVAGVRLAVDRFGANGTSLSVLREAPIDVLRVTAELLLPPTTDVAARIVAQAVIDLAASRGLDLVVQGGTAGPLQLGEVRTLGAAICCVEAGHWMALDGLKGSLQQNDTDKGPVDEMRNAP